MNWEAVGVIAEVVGAGAVVMTLVYLAVQIRQSNFQAQGEAYSSWLITWNDTIKGWINDRETIDVLQKGFADFTSLPHVDQAIFAQQLAALVNHWHLAADLVDRGLLGEQLYQGATELVLSVFATPGGRQFLELSHAAFPRGSQLLELARSETGSLPPFNVLAPWWSMEAEKPSERMDMVE